ncbi:MAG: hypothetical protein JMDDDDMK_02954 [Acidobacteria bacterium]|nr:hypothetical protein [Acidobacteriota bacterium]
MLRQHRGEPMMIRFTRFKYVVAITLSLLLTTSTTFTGASADSIPHQQQSQTRTNMPCSVSVVPVANAQAVLWSEPADIECRDLFYGAGGPDGAPDPSAPFTFVRRSKSGTQKKIIVKDNRDREWTVKFGLEARPETTATRIVWAAGYHVDQDYFVPQARIVGAESFDARNVRFERRDDGYKEIGKWQWSKNPFVGTRELEGLKILMALLNNWDLKSKNNDIVIRKKKPGTSIYYVADLGATFGRTGTFINNVPLFADWPAVASFSPGKAKGDPHAFSDENFIKAVHGDVVVFDHRRLRGQKALKGISVESARWMGCLLGRLSDQQLTDAFRAGGFNATETSLFLLTLRARIRQLQSL